MIFFDVEQPYYLPQYFPVCQLLLARGMACTFVFYRSNCDANVIQGTLPKGVKTEWVAESEKATQLYLSTKPQWLVLGTGFKNVDKIKQAGISTAVIYHGAGVKTSGYSELLNQVDVRFVEGSHHFEALSNLHPKGNFCLTGFSKLDPLINQKLSLPSLEQMGLDESKKTLLYAPTFYPSSIEMMAHDLPHDLADYNLIIKLHHFSYHKKKYQKQLVLAQSWAEAENVFLVSADENSILPYLGLADLLISEASSTLFEFAALNKPVVWCDFLKLRWTYRGIFSYRFKRRMDQRILPYRDIAAHAEKYTDLKRVIDEQIGQPDQFSEKRLEYSERLLGPLDGKASERIVDYLLNHLQ
ncbi:MAG: CDP-glycerol glycerophosphotransferase family protein [Gammaproteobacteria bacterium]|nr:CDP-glycerol glycerophosphotransferase family protein [Gammaproteobacteria bacterium]